MNDPVSMATLSAPNTRRLPIFTFGMLIAIVVIHYYLTSISPSNRFYAVLSYAFVPALIDPDNLSAATLITFVTHAFLHANWTHVLANSYALLLFGLLSERFLGPARVAVVYFLSAIGGAMLFLLLNPASATPLVGASGAISGLFGAAIISAPPASRRSLMINAVVWLGLNVGMPALATQAGGRIAWEAHLGGFLVGLLMGWILRASMPRAVVTLQPVAPNATAPSAAPKPEPFNPVQRR